MHHMFNYNLNNTDFKIIIMLHRKGLQDRLQKAIRHACL